MIHNKIFILTILFITTLFAQNPKSINVGIYQNEPKIFLDKNNKPSGFHVDLLNEIAKKENFQINYIKCHWDDCLTLLKENKIDIMPDVAYSKERSNEFLFSNEAIFSSWSYVYTREDMNLKSILDFQNKNVAVLKGSIQYSYIEKLLREYSISPNKYIHVDTWEKGFDSLLKKNADAIIVNRFYELNNKIDSTIIKTDIVVMPSLVKFAFSPSSETLIPLVDDQLKILKNDQNSIYYKAKKRWLEKEEINKLPKWVIWSLIILLCAIIVLIFIIHLFKKLVQKRTQELVQKEQIILMQSRHAAMGEMISMIAHQWRQPLSVITTSASGMKANVDFDIEVSKEDIGNFSDLIIGQANYLSQTIDNFRNFLKGEKNYSNINLTKVIDTTLNLADATIKNNHITLIKELDNSITIYGSINELCEAFINIINNSKDALNKTVESIEDRFIFITTKKTSQNKVIITFKDSGNGIPENILHRVFEPYFTSKHQSIGTGLGLTMSYKIVTERHNGEICATNEEFTYRGKKYKGACFTITLNNIE